MLELHPNEQMLLVIRKHWLLMAGPVVFFTALISAPPVVLVFLPSLIDPTALTDLLAPVWFGYILYVLLLLVFLFFAWSVYYLDTWIVTNERLIDVEQHGLFSREVSEIPLHRVQDVTIEVHGLLETLLHFGTIRIQTAGEREFVIKGVPRLSEIKDTILKYARPETAEIKTLNSKS